MKLIRFTTMVFYLLIWGQQLIGQDLSDRLLINYNFIGNYLDASPNMYHGSSSQTIFTTNRFNAPSEAVLFNGNSYVEMPNEDKLKPEFPLSVAFWVYPNFQFNGAEGLFGNDQTLDNYYGAFVSILQNGKLLTSYGDGCGMTGPECRRGFITQGLIENNKWYHIAVSFLDENNTDIYINGCLVPANIGGNGSSNMVYSDDPGAIGKKDHSDIAGNPIGYYNGIMDDFYYWDRALTQGDIDVLVDGFFSSVDTTINYVGCQNDGYNLTINNTLYNEANPSGVEYSSGLIGCDTITTIELEFLIPDYQTINYNGCIGDIYEVIVNSNTYNENLPNGQEILTNQYGCDSIITIDLDFNSAYRDTINYLGCVGDGYALIINTNIYNEDLPFGEELTLATMACDTITTINLQFAPMSFDSLSYIGCSGDGYEITANDIKYNELNPMGQEILTNQYGCDSLITIDLFFEEITPCDYYLPNVFSYSSLNGNDAFRIYPSIDCEIQALEIHLFDRWGNLIFHSTEIGFEWDGKFKNENSSSGVYTYLINIEGRKTSSKIVGDILFLH